MEGKEGGMQSNDEYPFLCLKVSGYFGAAARVLFQAKNPAPNPDGEAQTNYITFPRSVAIMEARSQNHDLTTDRGPLYNSVQFPSGVLFCRTPPVDAADIASAAICLEKMCLDKWFIPQLRGHHRDRSCTSCLNR